MNCTCKGNDLSFSTLTFERRLALFCLFRFRELDGRVTNLANNSRQTDTSLWRQVLASADICAIYS